jgi:diguanylate cyclase (GGDEF)-like protein
MKVLLAEDSRSNQLLIKAYVEDAGHEVITADDGLAVINLFAELKPDLVIMDVNMPKKDGIEAAREIRKLSELDNDWVPIVFLSAMDNSDDIVRGIDAGGDDYLTKPVDGKVLNAKLRAMQRIAAMRQQLQRANRKLELISMQDGLTGLANRRYFDMQFSTEMKRAIRSQLPLSVVMCDIDHFKHYNDKYGHQMGDECLKDVANAMQKIIRRPSDVLARYGGEEFVIILPETRLKNAFSIAQTLCLAVEATKIEHNYAGSQYLTLSVGAASITPVRQSNIEEQCYTLLQLADQALYEGKSLGRNRAFCAE